MWTPGALGELGSVTSTMTTAQKGALLFSGKAHSGLVSFDPLPPGTPCPTAPNFFPSLSPPSFCLVHTLSPFSILLRQNRLQTQLNCHFLWETLPNLRPASLSGADPPLGSPSLCPSSAEFSAHCVVITRFRGLSPLGTRSSVTIYFLILSSGPTPIRCPKRRGQSDWN